MRRAHQAARAPRAALGSRQGLTTQRHLGVAVSPAVQVISVQPAGQRVDPDLDAELTSRIGADRPHQLQDLLAGVTTALRDST
jgi:hypothetical protein